MTIIRYSRADRIKIPKEVETQMLDGQWVTVTIIIIMFITVITNIIIFMIKVVIMVITITVHLMIKMMITRLQATEVGDCSLSLGSYDIWIWCYMMRYDGMMMRYESDSNMVWWWSWSGMGSMGTGSVSSAASYIDISGYVDSAPYRLMMIMMMIIMIIKSLSRVLMITADFPSF